MRTIITIAVLAAFLTGCPEPYVEAEPAPVQVCEKPYFPEGDWR